LQLVVRYKQDSDVSHTVKAQAGSSGVQPLTPSGNSNTA